jgi:hypothetical protein
MERVQVIALAVLVAALALFGVGYVVDGGAAPGNDDVIGGPFDDGARSAVGIANREWETRRGRRDAGQGQPPESRRGRRDGADDARAGGGPVVLAGSGRGRGVLGRSGSSRDDEEPAGGAISAELLAARTGTLPRAGGAIEVAPRHASEPVDELDPSDDPRPDANGVLLSIPLKDSVDPEQGGGPTQAEGVEVKRDGVEFTEEAQYTLPARGHVDGERGTIAFELQPHWAGSDETNNSLLQIRDEHQWENNLQIVKNYNSLRFIIIDSAGVESNVNVYIDSWRADEPHRVTATWGEALMTLYVDGQQVGQSTLPNDLVFRDTTPIHVGSDFPGSLYAGADGRIRDLRIYGRPLAPGEIN